MKQLGSEEINDINNIRVSIVRNRKITTTSANTKPAIQKLLAPLTKATLIKNRRNINIQRYVFRTLIYKKQIVVRARRLIIL